MRCPQCNTGINEALGRYQIVQEPQIQMEGKYFPSIVWVALHQRCPECLRSIIYLESNINGSISRSLVVPRNASARPVPIEVTDPYKQDFTEACNVLQVSPKASAAISRRCLQSVLRDKAHSTSKDLFDQIEEVINSGKVPSHIAEGLHAVRVIGNFAAHPLKSTHTGEIVEVEDHEAEWNLDVIELLFDFYFVQPAISAKRKADLNKKLKDAGKPELP
jgi:hypothetical protein